MTIERVTLQFAPGSRWAGIRRLCGYDEQSITGTGTIDAIGLIDRLLVEEPGTRIGPGKAKQLTTSDRDRLLAAVYRFTYGSRISAVVNCTGCRVPFDMDFSLEELTTYLYHGENTIEVEKDPGGVFRLPDGLCFRLPDGEDECEVVSMSPDEAEDVLLARCIKAGDPKGKHEKLQETMQQLAPVMDIDLGATCPECQTFQQVHFDIQYYLLTAIIQEQNQLNMEMHRLASAYGWSLGEILQLPRSSRKALVALVEAEISPAAGRSR